MKTEYRLACCTGISSFEELVEELLEKKWMCVGGPFIHDRKLCQAMIKYTHPNDAEYTGVRLSVVEEV